MTLDLTLGALVTLGLLGYLTYALVRPRAVLKERLP